MKRHSIFLILVVVFLVANILFLVYLLFGQQEYGYHEHVTIQPGIPIDSRIFESLSDMSLEHALDTQGYMEDLVERIIEDDNVAFFTSFYNGFKDLDEYHEYKGYIEKFPELLPVIYAVRLGEKDEYLKFYGFIFDKVEEDDLYMQDIRELVGEDKTPEEQKQGFLKILGDHYDDIVSGNFSFHTQFGDGPLHIAMSENEVEEAKGFCEESEISGVNEQTIAECHDYIYQYRADSENKLCDEVHSTYQRRVCKGFVEYISLENN